MWLEGSLWCWGFYCGGGRGRAFDRSITHAGKTKLTQAVLYSSRAARDAVLKSPMEQGAAQGYDRLAESLVSLRPREMEKGAQGA